MVTCQAVFIDFDKTVTIEGQASRWVEKSIRVWLAAYRDDQFVNCKFLFPLPLKIGYLATIVHYGRTCHSTIQLNIKILFFELTLGFSPDLWVSCG